MPTFSICRLSKLAIIGLLLSTATISNAMDLTEETMQQEIHSAPDTISDVADSINKDVQQEQEQSGDANSQKQEEPPKSDSDASPEKEKEEEKEKPQEVTKLNEEEKEKPKQEDDKEKPKQEDDKEKPKQEEEDKKEDQTEEDKKEDNEKVEDQPVMTVVDTHKDDESKDFRGDDYVEESDTPDGRHIRKEVHKGPGGVQSVRMSISGGMPPMMGGRGGPGGLMQAIMQDMAQQMSKVHEKQNKLNGDKKEKKEEVIRMDGPMGSIVVRKEIHHDDDEEDDKEDGIPPEILQMMRMTEAMHRRHMQGMMGGMMGGPSPRQLQHLNKIKKDKEEDNTPRIEESHADIMAKMNKLSEEIGEKHDKDKQNRLYTSKNNRFKQVLVVSGIILIVVLASFALTCINNKKKDDDDQNEKEHQMDDKRSRVGKSD